MGAATAPFALVSRLSPAAHLPIRAWRAARPALGFPSPGRTRPLAVASAAQENRDNTAVDVHVGQNGGNQQGNAVQRRPRRAAFDISPFEPSMLVAACTKMTMSAAEEERCRVLLAKLKEAIDKRGVLLDKLGKVMDETVSSLASSTSLLVCGAADSTPNSTATNKVPAMANAAPSANTTLTDQAPPRCSTMCPDHSIDMPLSDCTTAVAPTSSSTIATLEIGNTFIANTVLVKSTECSKECEEQAVDTDHCVAAAGICAVASTNCLMECPRLVAGDSGVTNLIIVGSVTRIMGLQLKPPWPPPQGPETVLKLFHKQAQNIMMKVSGEFNFESGGSIHSLPKLHLNPYSWSKVSSVIYLHSPTGVGLSYSKNVSDYQTGDLKTAADSHTFLLKWFQRYPEFLSNPFYIAGESYAGVYVPTLSHEVVKGIQGGVKPTINFKGYMVGNGVCDTVFDGNALVPFAHGMGLISDDIYQEAGTACQGNYWNASTAKCEKALSKVDTEINELNIHDILEPCYHSTNIKVIPHKRLISMYVDSVTITNARRVFDGIKYKDIITWNSVISAFAQLGDLHQVLNLLSLMTEEMDPDDFTFAIVLAASANSATVQLRYAYAIKVMDISGILLSQAANSDPECANDIILRAVYTRGQYDLGSEMRGRNDGGQSKRPIVLLCVMVVCLCLFLHFSGSNGLAGSAAFEYGTKLSRSLGWGSDGDGDDGSEESNFGTSDADDVKLKRFSVCDDRHSELIPCLDRNLIYQMRMKLDLNLMEHYERHCPPPERRFNCLIPLPHGYKVPIKWPKSRDIVWKANIPHTHLAHERSDQNWMIDAGKKIKFPGGGTHFHHGADKYIANIANMLNFKDNNINNDGMLRTVLDVGCGVASFGGYLLSSNVIAMSLAPNDVHQNQIQFALERGIPAYLGVLGTKGLPYPSRSFELAHCSRCRIDWLQRDGILLLELDRLLRPGGYFAYSSPEAYAQDEEDRRIWKEMSALVERMCWKIAEKRNQTVIWVKPLNQ